MISTRLLFIVIFFLITRNAFCEENDTRTEYHRKERVNGRIVKLYSGSRPDQIVCQKEGFQADLRDCSIFYRCMKAKNEKYTVFRFQCAPGTIFDHEKEVCNYPQSAKRTNCRVPALENDENNEIANVARQELPQPIKTTQTPQNYVNSYNPISPGYYNEIENSGPISNDPYLTNQENTDSSPIVSSQINKVTEVNPVSDLHGTSQSGDICKSNGFIGDSKNCKKFYRCVNNLRGGFIRYEFSCSDATIWDESIQGCNHAWLARNTRCSRDNKDSVDAFDTFGDKNKYPEHTDMVNNINNQPDNFGSMYRPEEDSDYLSVNQEQMKPNKKPQNVTEFAEDIITQKPSNVYSPVELNYGDRITQPLYTSSVNDYQTIKNQTENYDTETNDNNEVLTSNRNDNCYKNGFFGYRDNCNKFYRCVENSRGAYTKYEFSCSEGTVWDDKLKACNFAWAVKQCGRRMPTEKEVVSSTHYPSHYVTNSFTTDNNDVDNGYGLHNGQSEITIINASSASPTAATQFTQSSTQKENLHYDGYQQNHDTFTTENINKLVESSKNENNKCTKSGFMGDNNNCNKFYRCVDSGRGTFIRYEFTCGDGTVWDSKIESCNHAWAVEKCGQNNEINSLNQESAMAINPPLSDNSESHYNGANVQTTTTLSSSSDKVVSYEPTEPTNSIFISPSTMGLNTLSSNNAEKSDEKGVDNCVSEGFYPDSKDCTKFYRCVHNGNNGFEKYDFTCGEGSAWDVTITSCNHIENVKSCGGNQVAQANEINEDNNGGKPSVSDDQTPQSIAATSTEATKSPSTQATKPSPTQTSKPSSTQTTKPSNIENTCSGEGYFGDTNDCQKFFRCVNDGKGGLIKYEYTCGEGTIWDQDILACNHPKDVKNPSCSSNNLESTTSGSGTTSSTTISTTTIPETSSTSTSSTTKEKETQTEQTTSTTTSSVRPTDSQQTCHEEGFFGNKDDCKSFYRCVNDGKGGYIKYDFTCGEGTIWDQDILACNHPQDVENPSCSQDASKTTNADTSTTEKVSTSAATSSTPLQQTTSDSSSSSSSSTETNDKPNSTTERVTQETTTSKSTTTSVSTSTTSSDNKPSTQDCNEEGYFGNSNDCKKFYRCVSDGKDGYTKYDFTCGEGTIWDQDITACNHPRDVVNLSCSENTDSTLTTSKEPTSSTDSTPTKTSTVSSSSTTTSASSSSSTTTEESNENTDNKEPEGKPEEQEKGNFTCTEAGFYPNPSDCKKFYRCVDWNNDGSSFSIFHFECGEGTIWDPSLDTCNHEDSVYPPRNCSGTQSETQSSTESTTTSETTEQPKTTTSKETTTQASSTESTSTQQTTSMESTTSNEQTSSTDQSTTQSSTSTTEQTTSTQQETTTTTTSTTTTEKSSTTTDQTTQTDKTTEESTTSEGTTQTSTTEQQSTSTTDSSIEATENDKTTTESTQQTTESSASSNDKCPEMNDDQNAFVCPTSFRRHPKYCNLFYQCTEDDDSHDVKIAMFHCPNETVYDESKTQCVNSSQAENKCDGAMAKTKRSKRLSGEFAEPMTVERRSYKCPGTGYLPFDSEDCSQAFLKCQRSKTEIYKGYIYKCPKGYTFWSVSKRCERISRVKDCKKSSYSWDKRHDIPTEVRNVAP